MQSLIGPKKKGLLNIREKKGSKIPLYGKKGEKIGFVS